MRAIIVEVFIAYISLKFYKIFLESSQQKEDSTKRAIDPAHPQGIIDLLAPKRERQARRRSGGSTRRRRAHLFPVSIAVMNHVWNTSPQAGGSLVLLLKLADWANDEGICYPSMAKLAKKSRMSERQARRIVRLLVAAGEISIEQVGGRIEGRNLANVYRVKTAGGGKMSSPDARVPAGGTFPVAWGGSGRPPIRKEPSKDTRGSRRGSFSFGESEQDLSDRMTAIRGEIREILHPGGCAQIVAPTRPEKIDRLRELEGARDLLKQAIAKKKAAA